MPDRGPVARGTVSFVACCVPATIVFHATTPLHAFRLGYVTATTNGD